MFWRAIQRLRILITKLRILILHGFTMFIITDLKIVCEMVQILIRFRETFNSLSKEKSLFRDIFSLMKIISFGINIT